MSKIETRPTETPDDEKIADVSLSLNDSLLAKPNVKTVVAFNLIKLNPGVSTLNYVCSVLFTMMTMFALTAAGFLAPLIIVDENYYAVHQDKAGTTNSIMLVVEMCTRVVVSIPYGKFTDAVGRKPMALYGMVSIFGSFMLTALQTNVYPGLLFARMLLANGIAATFAVPLIADYVADESKGKAQGVNGIAVSLTSLACNLFLKVLLKNKYSLGVCFISVAAFTLSMTFFIVMGLKGTKKAKVQADGQTAAPAKPKYTMKDAVNVLLGEVWLLVAFVLQILVGSDKYIFTTFMSLYVKSMFPKGTDSNTVSQTVNSLQTWLLVPSFAPNIIVGYLLDKTTKTLSILYVALTGAIAAFVLITQAEDPYDWRLSIAAALAGLTLPALFTIIGTLNNRHFPRDKRGLMLGFTNMCGNVGFVGSSAISGVLSDHWRKDGPFILVTGLLCLAGILVGVIYLVKSRKTKVIAKENAKETETEGNI